MQVLNHYGHKGLYIDGAFVESSSKNTFDVKCPANEEVVATIAWAEKEDTECALRAAEEGFKVWSKTPVQERVDKMMALRAKLLENKDLLKEVVSHEMGKTFDGADEDVVSITNSLEFYGKEILAKEDFEIPDREGTHQHTMVHQPLGVVVAFLAYNFPLLNLGFKLGPALAAGCSIIIKPSEISPLSALMIAEYAHEVGFPKGVITVLCGNRQNVGIPLCESTIPRLITMIGATYTAQKLIEQSIKTSIKRYSMECGGNAPFIVFDDANIDDALAVGTGVKYGNTGQICVAPNRFFVQEGIFDEYVKRFVEIAESKKLGFGRENNPDMGPLVSEKARDGVHQFVQDCLAQGGTLLTGGEKVEGKGFYYKPTVIVMDDPKAAVLQHEVFGPVAVILKFKTTEEVIQKSNDVTAGLASYVFTESEETMAEVTMALEFGEVQQNGVKYDIYLPHLGVKNSGLSMDCSKFALDDYLVQKRVSKKL
ncbi:aldehyde dehydrogenase family protein [Flammeovirga agarivorans]|uniref:Aldehyde dehydrogenase family protein n=1 Tax=Flammeovirga agarivorans TaxID=2726742 RepID=A0A7X8XVQ1_9BACT|nr:aldehyde dehydrogenase family protein [Flammeovirga agarivorans]NLR91548.1 aldehyde dehydrogenase family protein [Flammeovirga agarivorans]